MDKDQKIEYQSANPFTKDILGDTLKLDDDSEKENEKEQSEKTEKVEKDNGFVEGPLKLKPDLSTLRQSFISDNMAFVLADIYQSDDSLLEVAPRNLLKSALEKSGESYAPGSIDLSFTVTLDKVK